MFSGSQERSNLEKLVGRGRRHGTRRAHLSLTKVSRTPPRRQLPPHDTFTSADQSMAKPSTMGGSSKRTSVEPRPPTVAENSPAPVRFGALHVQHRKSNHHRYPPQRLTESCGLDFDGFFGMPLAPPPPLLAFFFVLVGCERHSHGESQGVAAANLGVSPSATAGATLSPSTNKRCRPGNHTTGTVHSPDVLETFDVRKSDKNQGTQFLPHA